jgi:hypothetical protein
MGTRGAPVGVAPGGANGPDHAITGTFCPALAKPLSRPLAGHRVGDD